MKLKNITPRNEQGTKSFLCSYICGIVTKIHLYAFLMLLKSSGILLIEYYVSSFSVINNSLHELVVVSSNPTPYLRSI